MKYYKAGITGHREIWPGIDGSGNRRWTVATLVNGSCKHLEHFDNYEQALNWVQYC